MAQLIHNGDKLDDKLEYELVFREHGVNASVVFEEGFIEHLNNVTEFHWRYKRDVDGYRVAFESDIHSTGLTYNCERILSVTLTKADKQAERF